MSTPAIHVPPREVETVVYSTGYEQHATGCVICGEPVTAVSDERLYCCRSHRTRANRIRNGKLPGELLVDPPARTCRLCGVDVPQPQPRTSRLCGRSSCTSAYRRRGFGRFRRLVKWPQPLSWLGPKLGLAPDDPRLAELAIALAQKGKLGVYIRADGTVGEVGRLRDRTRAER